METLTQLLESTQENTEELERLYRHAKGLSQTISLESLSSEAQVQLRGLMAIPEHTLEVIVQQRILKSLQFDDMYQRYEAVDDAHGDTFQWILNEGSVPLPEADEILTSITQEEESIFRANVRSKFLGWLVYGNGIFHISGKMGSGKSTLMKYIFQHDTLDSELKKWAGKLRIACSEPTPSLLTYHQVIARL